MHLLPSIWAYGHHFCTKDVNNGHVTLDCCVEVKLDQSSHASHCDQSLIKEKLDYIEKIQEIIQVDYLYFQYVTYIF